MSKILIICFFSFLVFPVFGQNNTNSPYSIFGIGELNNSGGGRNIGMGSTGNALRSGISLNSVNPASLTAIELKSFGMDIGFDMRLSNLENNYKSANVLNGNVSWFKMAFPINSSLFAAISLTPKSSVGYSIYSTKPLEGTNSSYPVLFSGEGGLSDASISLGLKVSKNFSIGGSTSLTWGNIDRNTEEFPLGTSVTSIFENDVTRYSGVSFKTGLQYYRNLNDHILFTLGGVAEFGGSLNCSTDLSLTETTSTSSSVIYSEEDDQDYINLPVKIGVGMALTFNQKTTFTFDYNRSDWTNVDINQSGQTLNINHSFHLGAELSPKFDPTRYGEHLKYRFGALYQTGYINVFGTTIDNYGLTLGLSIPIRHDKTAVNVSLEAGRQGSLNQLLVRESYVKLNCSFNLWERWFIKRVYD